MAVHNMLTDPTLESRYWGPMRRNAPPRVPTVAVADFAHDTSCQITLKFD